MVGGGISHGSRDHRPWAQQRRAGDGPQMANGWGTPSAGGQVLGAGRRGVCSGARAASSERGAPRTACCITRCHLCPSLSLRPGWHPRPAQPRVPLQHPSGLQRRGPLRTRQQLSCPPCHCPCTVLAVTLGQHMAVTPEETAAGTRGAGGRQTLARHSHPQGECTATGWGSPWHRPAGPRRAITPPAPWGRHPGIPGPHPVGLPRPPPGMPRPSRHRHPAAVPGEVVVVGGGCPVAVPVPPAPRR